MAKRKTRSKEKDIKDLVMKEISKGEIKMRPKAYFVLGSFLLIFGIFISLIFSSVFIHGAIFKFRTFTPFSYFRMGMGGMRPFFLTFPWIPLFISMGCIYLGYLLLKKYDFSYKKNFNYLIIGLLLVVFVFVLILSKLRFSERAMKIRGMDRFYKRELPQGFPTPPPFPPNKKVRGFMMIREFK